MIAEGSGDDEGKLSCRVYNLLSGVGLVGYETTTSRSNLLSIAGGVAAEAGSSRFFQLIAAVKS